jgi:signal transduction histidine kinase/ligand-binding sensor domain-containing protein/DNA-binding response OmpR family regulator
VHYKKEYTIQMCINNKIPGNNYLFELTSRLRLYLKLILQIIIINSSTDILFSQILNFNHLNTSHGLSSNNVFDILQDRSGFMWFATEDGLNRFDGYNFKIFRMEPDNENSLSDNFIQVITESVNGKIWIGTKSGVLNCYDPVSEVFTKYELKSDIVTENTITCLYADRTDNLWIGTYRSGLYKLDTGTGLVSNWRYDPSDVKSVSYNYILSITEDAEGYLWISTYYGLNRFNPKSASSGFEKFYKEANNRNSLSDNIIWNLSRSEIDKNLIWIGTPNGLSNYNISDKRFRHFTIPNPENLQFGTGAGEVIEEIRGSDTVLWINSYAGLLKYNLRSGDVLRFKNESNNLFSLPSSRVYKIYRDVSGVLWAATDNGITFLSSKLNKFNYNIPESFRFIQKSKLFSTSITALTKSRDGTIWFGTEKGLFFSEKKGDNYIIKEVSSLNNVNIWTLACGSNNDLWIGTYGKGFYHLDVRTKALKDWTDKDPRKSVSSRNFVKAIIQDDNNNILLGFWGLGLAKLNPITGEYSTWLYEYNNPNTVSHNDIWLLFQDSRERIWIGTNGGGLSLMDGGKFIHWTAEKGSLSSNIIYSICETEPVITSAGITVIWVGTNYGLNKIIIDGSEVNAGLKVSFENFSVTDGLADNSVKSIIVDDRGYLWMGTGSGISCFDPGTNKFMNFTEEDGIRGNDFNLLSALQLESGYIIMGSKTGLTIYNPYEIELSAFKPNLVITDFQIFNKSVTVGNSSLIKYNIQAVKEINIPYSDNVFSFEFAALDYSSPNTIEYAYMMDGFDKEWIYGGSRRFVTYTNLNPGEYTFKIKSTNGDKVWCDNTAAIRVIIEPPWWRSYWALLLYIAITLLGIYGIIRFQVYRIRLRDTIRIHEVEAHHLRELEKMKSRFIENISHEFRTPLTLIKGPLEQLLSGRIKENLPDYYRMILRNSERLQNLIEEMLELSKVDSESIPVNKQKHELVSLLRSFTYSFIPLAEHNKIDFSFTCSTYEITALIDGDKLEKIVNNLLSNAFKYTPAGGKITVDLTINLMEEHSNIIITVSDNGIGIPEDHKSKIFDRFHKVDSVKGGFGIGLSLVKEFVNLLNWEITFSSKEGKGSVFKLIIPYPAKTDPDYEQVSAQSTNTNNIKELTLNDEDDEIEQSGTKPVILVVEDSPEVRSFLSDLLKDDYEILCAENAETGIGLALQNMPDLILSDIMMPGMDGIEFCRRVKTNWQTSHIPVLLLTAKAAREDKIEGLETGADDYLTKPFNFEELSVRVKNLIEQRKHLREKFSKNINIEPSLVSNNSLDKEFLQNTLKIVEKNIEKEDFNTQILAEELFISKRQLHRKLLALTGHGPGEFIRIIRLKKAAKMLKENRFSITQIAYEVGFGSPAQFTRAFKKYFGCLPSMFNHKHADLF